MRCIRVSVDTPEGKERRTGWIGRCEDLVVHQGLVDDDWRVTHKQSGYAVCVGLPTRGAALWAVRQLDELAEWSQSKEELYAMDDDLKAKAKEIQSKARKMQRRK